MKFLSLVGLKQEWRGLNLFWMLLVFSLFEYEIVEVNQLKGRGLVYLRSNL